jgi:hypothetical protein
MEYVTAAASMTRMDATAEASLARIRERRKLGTAIAEMIKITVTTRSNSIRENPFRFLMNTPEAGSFAPSYILHGFPLGAGMPRR